MAIGTLSAIGAGIGGLAGAFGSNSTQTTQRNLGPAGSLENYAGQLTEEQLRQLSAMAGAGVGVQDTQNAADATRNYAAMLQQYSQTGANPNAQDISRSNQLASSLFAPQQLQLQQMFQDQSTQNSRLAAQLGRQVDDPILAAKLAQEQTRQQGGLNAQQGALGTQLSMQAPLDRLGFLGQSADTLNALSQQAFANRQAVAGLGSQVLGQQQQFRLGSADITTNQSSGGGIGGALTGGLAGFGAFAGIQAQQQQNAILQGAMNQQRAPSSYAAPMSFAQPYSMQQSAPLYQQFGLSAPGPSAANIPLGSNVGQPQSSSFLRPQGASFQLGKVGAMY